MNLPISKYFLSLTAALIIIVVAVLFFWNDIGSLLGTNNIYNPPVMDSRGAPINFVAGTRTVSIPPKYSEDVIDYLKQEMTENGGLPLRIERKGNVLPFGIP